MKLKLVATLLCIFSNLHAQTTFDDCHFSMLLNGYKVSPSAYSYDSSNTEEFYNYIANDTLMPNFKIHTVKGKAKPDSLASLRITQLKAIANRLQRKEHTVETITDKPYMVGDSLGHLLVYETFKKVFVTLYFNTPTCAVQIQSLIPAQTYKTHFEKNIMEALQSIRINQ